MLQMTNRPVHPRPLTHLRITGQSLAKAPRAPWERAVLAAKWCTGSLDLTPTTVMASKVFGVSVQLIRKSITALQKDGAFGA
jgi:hypothetical protein